MIIVLLLKSQPENELKAQYNAQGITKNFPQYGTNFWGNSANNYGFGMTNIADNIANTLIDYQKCLNGLRQGYVILRNKLFLILFTIFSCGKAYALPQDWPCKAFELDEYQRIENGEFTINNIYRGQDNDYALEVNMYWKAKEGIADCGTSGCLGTIKNIKTLVKSRHLRPLKCLFSRKDLYLFTCLQIFGNIYKEIFVFIICS